MMKRIAYPKSAVSDWIRVDRRCRNSLYKMRADVGDDIPPEDEQNQDQEYDERFGISGV